EVLPLAGEQVASLAGLGVLERGERVLQLDDDFAGMVDPAVAGDDGAQVDDGGKPVGGQQRQDQRIADVEQRAGSAAHASGSDRTRGAPRPEASLRFACHCGAQVARVIAGRGAAWEGADAARPDPTLSSCGRGRPCQSVAGGGEGYPPIGGDASPPSSGRYASDRSQPGTGEESSAHRPTRRAAGDRSSALAVRLLPAADLSQVAVAVEVVLAV